MYSTNLHCNLSTVGCGNATEMRVCPIEPHHLEPNTLVETGLIVKFRNGLLCHFLKTYLETPVNKKDINRVGKADHLSTPPKTQHLINKRIYWRKCISKLDVLYCSINQKTHLMIFSCHYLTNGKMIEHAAQIKQFFLEQHVSVEDQKHEQHDVCLFCILQVLMQRSGRETEVVADRTAGSSVLEQLAELMEGDRKSVV